MRIRRSRFAGILSLAFALTLSSAARAKTYISPPIYNDGSGVILCSVINPDPKKTAAVSAQLINFNGAILQTSSGTLEPGAQIPLISSTLSTLFGVYCRFDLKGKVRGYLAMRENSTGRTLFSVEAR